MDSSVWPFSFGETLILVGTITTSIISVIGAIQGKKIHTLVNQKSIDQDNKIVSLTRQLSASNEALTTTLRSTLVQDVVEAVKNLATVAVIREADVSVVTLPSTAGTNVPTASTPHIIVDPEGNAT